MICDKKEEKEKVVNALVCVIIFPESAAGISSDSFINTKLFVRNNSLKKWRKISQLAAVFYWCRLFKFMIDGRTNTQITRSHFLLNEHIRRGYGKPDLQRLLSFNLKLCSTTGFKFLTNRLLWCRWPEGSNH